MGSEAYFSQFNNVILRNLNFFLGGGEGNLDPNLDPRKGTHYILIKVTGDKRITDRLFQ